MAAGFMYANRDIIKKDIRHIYSGPPTDKRFYVRTYHSGIDHLTRLHEMQTRPRPPREPVRCYEYLRQYDVAIPRAPAFKRLSKSAVDDIVNRLHGSKLLDEKKLLEQVEPKNETKDVKTTEKQRVVTSRFEPVTAEKIDIGALIQRLHYNGDTHVSKLRQRQPVYRLKERPQSSYT